VRRIDTYVRPRDRVTSGELIGLIKFGSRVDLIIPKASRFKLLAQEGDYLRGSNSVIGHYI
jgi:phosphatidylserine decarboxylase